MMTPKRLRFIEEYMKDNNATQAAIRAGYSKPTSRMQTVRLLRDPEIAAEIARRKAELSKEAGITALEVIEELRKIGFSDISDYVAWGGGKGVQWHESGTVNTRAVSKISFNPKTGQFVLTMYDKVSALDKLAKHLGLYTEDSKTPVDVDFDAAMGEVDGRE